MKSLLILLPLSCLLAGCRHPFDTAADVPVPKADGNSVILPEGSPQAGALTVEPVQTCRSTVTRLNGRLLWGDDVTVRIFSPFAGRVLKITTEVGRQVARGEPLAQIASPDYGQAQADCHKAASDFVLAERNLNRLRELFEHGAAAQKDLHSAEADYHRAEAEQVRADAKLTLYGGTTNAIDQVYELRSPLDGFVVERSINPGQEVRPDAMLANAPQFFAPLFVVTDPTRLWIQVDATEQDLPQLKPGVELAIRTRAYPDQVFRGKVEFVADFLDPSTRTIKVRGSVPNAQRLLKAEMFVSAELSGASEQVAGLDVSAKAVFFKGSKHFIFVEESPGHYQRTEVKVGPEHEGRILVLDGLHAGQRVVSEGCLLLDQLLQTTAGL